MTTQHLSPAQQAAATGTITFRLDEKRPRGIQVVNPGAATWVLKGNMVGAPPQAFTPALGGTAGDIFAIDASVEEVTFEWTTNTGGLKLFTNQ